MFFATRHYEKQTAAKGCPAQGPDPDVRALMTGEVKRSLTMEFGSSNQAVRVPAKARTARQVRS